MSADVIPCLRDERDAPPRVLAGPPRWMVVETLAAEDGPALRRAVGDPTADLP